MLSLRFESLAMNNRFSNHILLQVTVQVKDLLNNAWKLRLPRRCAPRNDIASKTPVPRHCERSEAISTSMDYSHVSALKEGHFIHVHRTTSLP